VFRGRLLNATALGSERAQIKTQAAAGTGRATDEEAPHGTFLVWLSPWCPGSL